MNRTVFISSTYEDLKEHRKEVWDVLTKYDVIIRGMEKFGARKEAPLQTCISEVEQSDIFVGIISYRLGTIDKKSAKSFVQCEYEKALELDRDIYIYLIDDNEGMINPKHIDFDEKHEKLKAFKSILKERHTIDTFKNPKNLAEKLTLKFDELLKKKKTKQQVNPDDFSYSKELMDKFLLLPNTYSDKQIKLRIKIQGDTFPASKAICKDFYFTYGSTIGVRVELIEPAYTGNEFEYLFITERNVEDFFNCEQNEEIDIMATLRFSQETVETIKAHFKSTTYIKYPDNYGLITGINLGYSNPWEQPRLESHTEPGEGQIIIELKSILTKKEKTAV